MNLNNLKPAANSTKSDRRIGRGQGSGKGGTSTRGNKGAQARSGYSRKIGFEGGQMPVYRRLPKRGFVNIFRKTFSEINVGDLQKAIDAKLLKADKEINEVVLMEAGLIKKVKDGVRLLGKGKLKTKLTIKVVGATKSAIAMVEKAGGSVVVEPIKKTVLEKGKKTSKKTAVKKTTKKTK